MLITPDLLTPYKDYCIVKRLGLFFLLLALCSPCFAQDAPSDTPPPAPTGPNPDAIANSYLKDQNGDGLLTIIAFGDSLVRGIGDFMEPGEDVEIGDVPGLPAGREAGYPLRLETDLVISVDNEGNPGEKFTTDGIYRFARAIPGASADLVLISGGSNDAFTAVSSAEYFREMQVAINIARASGAFPMLVTVPTPCGQHAGLAPFVDSYNSKLGELGTYNSIPVAPVNHAFGNTCDVEDCTLLNLPEGLHPNSRGYDVFAEAVEAALLKINLFAPDGPANLELALNLPAGSVVTQPDPVPVAPPAEDAAAQ